MALVLADRVRETTTVTGTGTATLLGAVSGYQSFSAVGNANTTYYVIANQSASEWEVGIGTYTSSGTTLSRTTVLSSSNSGSLVNFSAGTKDVFVDYPASKAVYEDASGNIDSYPITGGTIDNTVIGGTTPAAATFTTLTAQTEVLKGTGQNFLLWSADFSNAVWGGVSSNVTRTTTTIDFTNASAYAYQLADPAVTGSTYTFSVTLSSTNKTAIAIRLVGSATSGGNQSLITLTATPTRYSVTATLPSGNTAFIAGFENRVAQGGDGSLGSITVSNAQLELGSTVNTYIATTTAKVYGTPTLSFSGVSTIGLESNGSLFVQPAGTGALQAQATTSSAVGGNARGANAVDWQTTRSGATQVAANTGCVIGGGSGNTASSLYSGVASGLSNTSNNLVTIVAGGQGNIASGGYSSVVGGVSNTASGYMSIAGGGYGNVAAGYFNFIGGGFTNSGTSGSAVTTQSSTMNGTTAVTLAASNANIKVGQYITGTSIAADTYVAAISGTSLTLSKVASGSSTSTLSFYTPHGVVVGGGNNQATGSYSFIGGGGDAGTAANRNVASGDWSTVAGGFKNTAIQAYTFIGGGNGNVASGSYSTISGGSANGIYASYATIGGGLVNGVTGFGASVLGGYANSATGSYSATGAGTFGTTRSVDSLQVFSSGAPISGTAGVSQAALLIIGTQTTDATATVLRSNTSAAGTTNQVILPNNSAYTFRGEIVSGVTGGGNSKSWTIEGLIKRGANAAATTLVGSTVTSMFADVGAATWAIALSADTTNGGLAVTFTGQAATTIRTVCQIRTTEMTY